MEQRALGTRNKENNSREVGAGKPRVPCRYFMEGKCTKDDDCTFSHAVRPNRTAEEARSEEVCRYHIAGNCLKGNSCMYSHDLLRIPCKYFHATGECAARSKCRFSHAPVSEEVRHQLFLEMTGARDPRLVSTSPLPTDDEPLTSRTPTPPPAHSWMPQVALHPAVALFNPFGSPF